MSTLAEIAEICLDQEQYDMAINYSESALTHILPLHAKRV